MIRSRDGFRFLREDRLLDAAAFGRVFKKAHRSRDKFFTVLSRARAEEGARLGMAISKKNCRKATTRNRIKRVIRESFRYHQDTLNNLDVVVINQPAASLANNKTISDSLEQHWRRCQSSNKQAKSG